MFRLLLSTHRTITVHVWFLKKYIYFNSPESVTFAAVIVTSLLQAAVTLCWKYIEGCKDSFAFSNILNVCSTLQEETKLLG